MSRIELTDTEMSAIMKMADGNPGAIFAIMDLMSATPSIDPQSALGSMGPIFALDTHGIYGSSIYVLYSDKCGRDCRKMLLVLRAVQLGFRSESWLKALAEDQLRQNNISDAEWDEIDAAVCERLEEFARAA